MMDKTVTSLSSNKSLINC